MIEQGWSCELMGHMGVRICVKCGAVIDPLKYLEDNMPEEK